MSQYPESEKQLAATKHTQPAGEFLDWLLSEKGFSLARFTGPERMVPVYANITDLLAEWQGIDLNQVEAERRQMIEDLKVRQA